MKITFNDQDAHPFLPDFCSGRSVLVVALISQVLAFVLILASPFGERPMVSLILMSLYLQWFGLSSAAAMCFLRKRLQNRGRLVSVLLCFAVLLLTAALLAEAAWQMTGWFSLRGLLTDFSHSDFLLRNICIAAMVSTLVLRYFWQQAKWRRQVQSEARARYEALRARIRPHFLFNSLNSIAALTRIDPEDTEQMVVDLSDLFRVTLSGDARLAPLSEELALTQAYARIEQRRLGERLQIDWRIPESLLDFPVPLLTIQPLVENAVYHGVEQQTEPSRVVVNVRATDDGIEIMVSNEIAAGGSAHTGSQSALANIAERLEIVYGKSARLLVDSSPREFRVFMTIPRPAQQLLEATETKANEADSR